MDPNMALKGIRSLVADVIAMRDHGELTPEEDSQLACLGDELAEQIRALDGWLSKGGFLPKAWAKEAETNG